MEPTVEDQGEGTEITRTQSEPAGAIERYAGGRRRRERVGQGRQPGRGAELLGGDLGRGDRHRVIGAANPTRPGEPREQVRTPVLVEEVEVEVADDDEFEQLVAARTGG